MQNMNVQVNIVNCEPQNIISFRDARRKSLLEVLDTPYPVRRPGLLTKTWEENRRQARAELMQMQCDEEDRRFGIINGDMA